MFSIRIEMNNWKFSGLNFKKFQVRFLFFDPHPNWRSQSAPSAPKTSRPTELLLQNSHSCNSSDISPNALWYESSHQSWCLRQMQPTHQKSVTASQNVSMSTFSLNCHILHLSNLFGWNVKTEQVIWGWPKVFEDNIFNFGRQATSLAEDARERLFSNVQPVVTPVVLKISLKETWLVS